MCKPEDLGSDICTAGVGASRAPPPFSKLMDALQSLTGNGSPVLQPAHERLQPPHHCCQGVPSRGGVGWGVLFPAAETVSSQLVILSLAFQPACKQMWTQWCGGSHNSCCPTVCHLLALTRSTQCPFSVGQVVATHTYVFAILGVPAHMQIWVATHPATFEAGTPQGFHQQCSHQPAPQALHRLPEKQMLTHIVGHNLCPQVGESG